MFQRRTILALFLRPSVIELIVVGIGMCLLTGCSANFTPSPVDPAEASQTPIGNIQGSVHGGQAPVTGAQIYLYQASMGGYGTAATSLICNKNLMSATQLASCQSAANVYQDSSNNYYVKTDAYGDFALGGDYVCTGGDQVYMVAAGGNPGLAGSTTTATYATNSSTITVTNATGIDIGAPVTGSGLSGNVTAVSGTTVTLSQKTTSAGSGVPVTFGVNNTAIVQMAALGQCPTTGSMASQVPWLVINEATTVAFAYAVGGFATTPYNVSTDATGATALANAFANATSMVILANGQAPATFNGNANSINPQGKINTLANILATCVNTQPVSATQPSSNCTSLYKLATTTSGTQATDEGSAIFNIVHNQAVQIINGTTTTQNAANLFNLSTGATAFSPTVGAVTDWTMPVIYKGVISTPTTSGTPTTGPYNIAFDASGNAWIGDRSDGVVKIAPQGVISTFSSGFTTVKGVAVSPQDGTIWVSDFGKNAVDVMNSSGTTLTTIKNNSILFGPVLTGFAVNPTGTAADDYLAFEVNETTASVLVFDPTTEAVIHNANNSNYTYVTTPGWITIDSYGAAWMPSVSNGYVGNLSVSYKNGTQSYPASETNLGYGYSTTPETMGTAGDATGNIWAATGVGGSVLVQFSGPTVGAEFTSGGLNNPEKTFVDGNNTVWVGNAGANVISALSTAAGINNANWLSSTGFATSAASATGCTVIGVDPSGNVWAGNSDQSVTMLPGLGTPTAAPLYAGTTVVTGTGKSAVTTLTNGNLGTKP